MLPDTVNGLPLHPLSVHATVVLVPLLALLGVLFALPPTRSWARWPLGLVAVAAAAATFVSVQSGEKFEEAIRPSGPLAELIERHEELAKQLLWLVLAYAVIAVVAALLVDRGGGGQRSAGQEYARGRGATGSSALTMVFAVLLVVGAVVVAGQTYRVGEIGSEAVWNPTGDTDYSTD